jgi:Flp pilus assembly pilin Flp
MAMLPRSLLRDRRGVTVVEFGLIAPVLLLTVMGLFDLAYTMYANSMLQGAIQKAARDSSLENATPATVDARVTAAVRAVVPGVNPVFSRKYYSNFSNVGRAEEFNDSPPLDGICNSGEPFTDLNGNGLWDSDIGRSGLGGARDSVLYSVTLTYTRPFPVANLIGQSNTFTLRSQTVLRNQPFGLQGNTTSTTGNCP